ncbi:hypothetical protein CRUP_005436 [Coryphaenoides rupestris]|nr:hypothetical protein CRUP_005436 [Coryphaenoides rupestris]
MRGSEGSQSERAQSASVESIPEVLEDKDSLTEQSDGASVHDMDYVNPRGVRFTQCVPHPIRLPCLRELFRFLISLTNPHDRHNTDAMMHMGLQLLTVALESSHIAPYQSLLGLVKDELCRHLFQRMNLYTASIRCCFLLFESMRGHLKFQLENIKMPYEMKETALEALVQLWRIPGFVTDLYINYDCDFYCSNLFEDLTKLLSKNAFPVSGQLYTTHLLSLEALLTVIDSTEAHCQAKVLNSAAQQDQSEDTILAEGQSSVNESTETMTDLSRLGNGGGGGAGVGGQGAPEAEVTGPVCPPTSGHLMAEKMKMGRQDHEDSDGAEKKGQKKPLRFSSCSPESQELMGIKTKKKLLITGTEQFNQKPKKGIQFLQDQCLLSTPMDNDQVAQWLRENPRLDKKMIGEIVSDRKHMELLDSFVNTFTFQGLRIDEALRLYLEAFRLPGEAPVIQRLLETFTDNWHDFDQDMLEDIYNAIKTDEIVMPDEQSGLVKENYVWSVLLHRGATSEGLFLSLAPGSYDHDLFSMTWGPTIAALSYVFDKSLEETILQKAIAGFRKCAMISAHFGFSNVFDNLIISLCKFTTLSSESVENLPTVFGSNGKAQVAAKTVFHLAHRHGDILREGWKNIVDSMLQLFRAELLPKAMVEVEDFVEPNGKISLQREETPSNRGESAVLSFVNWLTLSGAEQSGHRGPSTENQEAKQAAILCIKALISVTPDEETYDEEDAAFCLEMLLRIVMENRDRVACVWQTVREHLCQLCVHANESCFLVERAVVGLMRLAIRLLRRDDISSQPHVLARVSREVAFGLHELLKTNAANIHSTDDWYTLFSLLESVGAGVRPPASFRLASVTFDHDTGTQSDSELPSHQPSEAGRDRISTSDSEVYTDHGRARMPCSIPDVDVGKDDLEMGPSKPGSTALVSPKAGPLSHPLVNQYSLTLGQDLGQHDTKSLIKCVETLSFIVRDAAHVTPDNFELCVKAIRVFVEASLNGGYRNHDSKKKKYDSSKSRLRKKAGGREREGGAGGGRRGGTRGGGHRPSRSHSDEEEDESVPASYHTVSLQLLDLMHTLHTRAASIYSSWAEEQHHLEGAKKIAADSQTLWTSCWYRVRMQALTYLQRALLVHDLQTLDAAEWESCFNKLLDNISPADVGGMEETRMRACTLLSKVFLQHLSPLLSLPTFAALWLTILDFMDKYMHAGSSDLLLEAIPESLKNMLLVMDTAGIFHCSDSRTGYSDLWEITWERIVCFLPHLREELFKQTVVIPGTHTHTHTHAHAHTHGTVGVTPMSLPIILNPALIEASSPVPLLPVGPRPTSPAHDVK